VVVNPAADNGATARYWPKARAELHAAGLSFESALTEGPGHAAALARAAGEAGYDAVLYVGGDGTANEVTNGLMNLPTLARPALAALPRGTGGDFPKSLGLAPGAAAAARRLLAGRERTVDLALARFTGLDGAPARRYFLNIGDVGIGGFVAERVNRTSKMTLTVDATRRFAGPATSIAVANGPRFGGGMLMAPGAQPDDGLLDVVVIGDITKVDLALTIHKLYRGTHLSHPKVSVHRGREVLIDTPVPVPLELDGEHPGHSPLHVWVEPAALRVVV